jgi:hypothetical protein
MIDPSLGYLSPPGLCLDTGPVYLLSFPRPKPLNCTGHLGFGVPGLLVSGA